MPDVHIHDVPPAVHATLSARAAAAGQPLQNYLLAMLTEEALTPTLTKSLDRSGEPAPGTAPLSAAVAAVRADRDGLDDA